MSDLHSPSSGNQDRPALILDRDKQPRYCLIQDTADFSLPDGYWQGAPNASLMKRDRKKHNIFP
jgi:hypothetical protein